MATASEGVTPGSPCDSAHCTLHHTHQSRAQIFARQATYQICGTLKKIYLSDFVLSLRHRVR
jgi:hypothetical protein